MTTPTDRSIVVVTAGLTQPSSTRLLADRLGATTEAALVTAGLTPRLEVIELREQAQDLVNHLLTGFPSPALRATMDRVLAADGDLFLELRPASVVPAVEPDQPGGRTGIDPAVERLVALTHLLPFEPLESLPRPDGDQLLGGELPQPFGWGALRQVDKAAGPAPGPGTFFIGWSRQPQEAIGLALEPCARRSFLPPSVTSSRSDDGAARLNPSAPLIGATWA